MKKGMSLVTKVLFGVIIGIVFAIIIFLLYAAISGKMQSGFDILQLILG